MDKVDCFSLCSLALSVAFWGWVGEVERRISEPEGQRTTAHSMKDKNGGTWRMEGYNWAWRGPCMVRVKWRSKKWYSRRKCSGEGLYEL
jgi:hypothetical protein